MDYLTMKQVAELKGCSFQYVHKLIKNGKLKAEQRENPQNKGMCYMISVSALSEDLQIKYYNSLKKECGITLQLQEADKKKTSKRSKGVLKPFEEYSEVERNQIVFWSNLLDEWQRLRADKKSKTEFDALFVAKTKFDNPDLELSVGILYRKYTAYKENDLNGLIDNRGGHNKGKSSIPTPVWEYFLDIFLTENKPSISRCYLLAQEWCKEFYPELVEKIPAERTFRRHVENDVLEAIKIYMRDGEKAMKDKCLPYIQRMYDNLNANDVWIADNHTLDIISEDDETHTPHRLYITTFQDAKSGVITGWNITDSPSSQSTVLALRHGIERFGIPKIVYVDNGREFLTKDVGGKGHRTRKKVIEKEEPIPATILQRLQIEMRNAIVKNAKAKPIERTFYTLKNQLSKAFKGYCGGTILERPESLKRRIKNGEIPQDYEVRQYLNLWIDGDYNVQAYGGNEQNAYQGMSRIDVWNKTIKNVGIRKATNSDLNLMLMRTTQVQKVKRNGVCVKVRGEDIWFYNPNETYKYLKENVFVRYNPADLTSARIYDENDRYLTTWQNADILLVDYIEENKQRISDAEKMQRTVSNFIKEQSKGITSGLTNEQRINMLDMTVRRANSNLEKFNIQKPTRIVPITIDEELPKAVGFEEKTTVVVDLTKMANNNLKRKR